jgi:hypothetical protein
MAYNTKLQQRESYSDRLGVTGTDYVPTLSSPAQHRDDAIDVKQLRLALVACVRPEDIADLLLC